MLEFLHGKTAPRPNLSRVSFGSPGYWEMIAILSTAIWFDAEFKILLHFGDAAYAIAGTQRNAAG